MSGWPLGVGGRLSSRTSCPVRIVGTASCVYPATEVASRVPGAVAGQSAQVREALGVDRRPVPGHDRGEGELVEHDHHDRGALTHDGDVGGGDRRREEEVVGRGPEGEEDEEGHGGDGQVRQRRAHERAPVVGPGQEPAGAHRADQGQRPRDLREVVEDDAEHVLQHGRGEQPAEQADQDEVDRPGPARAHQGHEPLDGEEHGGHQQHDQHAHRETEPGPEPWATKNVGLSPRIPRTGWVIATR